ncbi:RNase H family protein [Aggregatilineales bacterium SYSU G02658]
MTNSSGYRAYVDGSFIDGRVGYGAVILRGDEVVAELCGEVTAYRESRQVAGELAAVMRVVDYCKAHGIPQVDLHYDYAGIEMWATGRWKANLPMTQAYQQYMKRSPVNVRFRKVRSHSNDKWNDHADALARQGATGGAA